MRVAQIAFSQNFAGRDPCCNSKQRSTPSPLARVNIESGAVRIAKLFRVSRRQKLHLLNHFAGQHTERCTLAEITDLMKGIRHNDIVDVDRYARKWSAYHRELRKEFVVPLRRNSRQRLHRAKRIVGKYSRSLTDF